MPILELSTNVKAATTEEFTAALAKAGTAILGMDKFWTVTVRYDESLIFGGTHEPAFIMSILTVLGLPTENNIGYSEGFFKFMDSELGIPHDRGYIIFNDPGPDRLGWKSTTFNVHLKAMGK